MILESLCNFHRQLVLQGVLPVVGFERRPIKYVVELAKDGSCVNVTDYMTSAQTKHTRYLKFDVPTAVRRTSGVLPNLLWDNTEYTLGLLSKLSAEPRSSRTVERKFLAFRDRIVSFANSVPNDSGMDALLSFYANMRNVESARALIGANTDHSGATVSFRLQGDDTIIAERPSLRKAIVDAYCDSQTDGQCLVTGEIAKLSGTHGLIKGLRGGHAAGTSLVSFNLDAARSFGMKRTQTAPISQYAAAAYVCALNWLLQPENHHVIYFDPVTVLCWEDITNAVDAQPSDDPLFYDIACHQGYDPDLLVGRILTALQTGSTIYPVSASVCLLALVPNVSRAAAFLWRKISGDELLSNIELWQRELSLSSRLLRDKPLLTTTQLVIALNSRQKSNAHVQSRVALTFIQAAFCRSKLSPEILAASLNSLKRRSSESVAFTLTAIVKLMLERNHNISLSSSLDMRSSDVAYRLGRLFAVIERLQQLAYPRIVTTVRDQFWSSSSATPAIGFKIPLRMAPVYLNKIPPRSRSYFSKVFEEIMSLCPVSGLPARFSIIEQGMFAVGYYHQRSNLAGWAVKKSDYERS